MKSPVVILDFGSQYTQLIARRVRELGVYCEIHPFHRAASAIAALEPQAIILSGGPASVDDPDAPLPDPAILAMGLPILGICYGCQYLTHQLGGHVARSPVREFGRATLTAISEQRSVASGEQQETGLVAAIDGPVWMSHSDHVETLAPGFVVTARTSDGVVAAIEDRSRNLYGVQFHPEVHHTPAGKAFLAAFLFDVAKLTRDWTPAHFVTQSIAKIRAQVGDGNVICGLSGGVDSAVAAALVHAAIGDRLHCVFVDTGLLRKGEAADVVHTFGDQLGFSLTAIDARERFFGALGDTSDPETKRKTIGRVFIDVFEAAVRQPHFANDADFLCQGTLYPDVIESVSVRGPSATIKTHHNVGGLPARMRLQLVEPLRELFKDEVREVGRELGLPEHVLMREPFPGPGLAIRILGPISAERVATLQEADAIVREELAKLPNRKEIWQSFAVLLPVRSVGVMGDNRTYEEVCAVRAVTSVDGMTADVFPVPYDTLGRIATRIVNEVRGINRVVYDVTSKPPGTIEWE